MLPSGYRLRPATFNDLEACVRLCNAHSQAATGADLFTTAQLNRFWRAPGITPESNMRVFVSPDNDVAGHIEVFDNFEPPLKTFVVGCVHPQHEDQGLGTVLLQWAEVRSREAIDRCPADSRVVMHVRCYHDHPKSRQLAQGYRLGLIRHFLRMEVPFETPPSPPRWPQGINVRTYRHDEDLLAVMRADVEAFRDHWGFIEEPEDVNLKSWRQWIGLQEFDANLWFLAFDGNRLAGICLCLPTSSEVPGFAYVNTLAVLRPWRRQGLGLALLRHALCEFHRRGHQGGCLHVDAENLTGATRLYEQAGMKRTLQTDLYEKELRPGVNRIGNT